MMFFIFERKCRNYIIKKMKEELKQKVEPGNKKESRFAVLFSKANDANKQKKEEMNEELKKNIDQFWSENKKNFGKEESEVQSPNKNAKAAQGKQPNTKQPNAKQTNTKQPAASAKRMKSPQQSQSKGKETTQKNKSKSPAKENQRVNTQLTGTAMAKHEFGIMNVNLKPNKRYDTYEPEKYDCISVHDDYIEPLLEKLAVLDCFWHTLDRAEKNLAYYGITLIPPSSFDELIKILEGTAGTEELRKLILKAKQEDKFIIHYGI
mgnify:CR=1 FL=1